VWWLSLPNKADWHADAPVISKSLEPRKQHQYCQQRQINRELAAKVKKAIALEQLL
jgi:hypothetical protein